MSGIYAAQLKYSGMLPKGYGDILYHHPYAYRKDFSDLKFYPDVPKYVIKVPGVVYPATYVQFSPRDWKMNQTTDNKDIHLPGDFTDLQRDIACYSAS
ncbi:hypothetical protein B5807_09839 [Epicoccum nigrum]|uniref:Uncharacterized protein n=1 Tax=Epicoccum nigrum TaxID=105696 RepID=A0A1Y2LTZ2_EPING|nr:hypothetical protein B5807_09839 [Epicoccum nigrum]